MQVKQLIDLLQRCDQEADVWLWNVYCDEEARPVSVSIDRDDKRVHVGEIVYGTEITTDTPKHEASQ